MSPEKVNVAAVIPIIGKLADDSRELQQFEKAVQNLKNSRFVNSIYCVTEEKSLAESSDIKWLDRKSVKKAAGRGICIVHFRTELVMDQFNFRFQA